MREWMDAKRSDRAGGADVKAGMSTVRVEIEAGASGGASAGLATVVGAGPWVLWCWLQSNSFGVAGVNGGCAAAAGFGSGVVMGDKLA
jgi:hypothetical protein